MVGDTLYSLTKWLRSTIDNWHLAMAMNRVMRTVITIKLQLMLRVSMIHTAEYARVWLENNSETREM